VEDIQVTIPEIKDTINALRQESKKLQANDSESTDTINELIGKLEQQLKSPTIEDHHSLIDHLKQTVSTFEYEHPRITAIVNDLMVKLASLGV